MLARFDSFLIFATVLIFGYGIVRRYRIWKVGCPKKIDNNQKVKRLKKIITYMFGHKKLFKNPLKGISHLFIFWGFILPLLVIIVAQFNLLLPAAIGSIISILLDVCGVLGISGIIIIFWCKVKDSNFKDAFLSFNLWILLAIFVTGFLAEGARIGIENVINKNDYILSPIGLLFSFIAPKSPVFLSLIIRIHLVLFFIFISCLPFTILKHLITGILNVYYQDTEPHGMLKLIILKGEYFGSGHITKLTWKDILDADACVNCGRCDKNCPAFISGQMLSPRNFIQQILKKAEHLYKRKNLDIYYENNLLDERGLVGEENIWNCTTCFACVQNCPVLVEHLDKIINIRRYAVLTESDKFPKEYINVFKNIENFGDTLGKGEITREDWVGNIKVEKIYKEPKTEILFWVGCMGSLYDERSKNTTAIAVKILKKAGVDFRILGKEEKCCGDPARKMGNEYIFQKVAKENIDTFNRYKIKNVVTFCPHCFNVFKNEYVQFGANFEVMHFTQLIKNLINKGKLKVKIKNKHDFTYHDPCYMTRYNNLAQIPRDIFDHILDSGIKEMKHSKNNTFCCGAGGGNFWRGKISGKRMENLRIEEAICTEAEGIITACPFCKVMFESAVEQKKLSHSFKVVDIIELINQAT